MQERPVIGLSEALSAIEAVMAEAMLLPGRPIAVMVVDHHGDMVAFACEADVNPALARLNAFKKAYTSACMRVDGKVYGDRMRSQGAAGIAALNANFMGAEGGLVIKSSDGTILGGLGVSGRPDGAEDEALAQAGLRSLRALL
jgi:uncharacterized protein GlcG (DUF336 family)